MIEVALTVLALASPQVATVVSEDYRPRHKGCHSRSCDKRMDRKQHRRAVAIRKRRAERAARRYDTMRRNYTRPYRGWLYSTRMCESGGRYGISTGNGFYGAYQFTLQSWAAVGGRGMPHLNAPLEQDYRAVRLLHLQGRGAWPVCG